MSKYTVPFWESNLNPITMFSTSIPKRVGYNEQLIGSYIRTEDLDDYVSAIELRKKYNIGGKKLKNLFATLMCPPKYNNGKTYYSNKYLKTAIEILTTKKETEIDLDKYISNQDLMDMFGFNSHKAWHISTVEKLVKKRFSGNINYYEREKAIAVFSKYIKNRRI
jgi:hypothetical protein